MISRKHRQVCTFLNYIEHFISLASTITGCISISAYFSLIGIPVWIVSPGIGSRKKKRSMIK